MLKRILATAVLAAGVPFVLGQVTLSVSLDSTAPAGRVTADIFANLAPTDSWTAGGLRAIAMNGATFHYASDDDPNTTYRDLLIAPYRNGPVTDQHVVCLSRPRTSRTSDNRFNNNAGASNAGRYSPPAPPGTDVATLLEVNTTWFCNPPNTFGSPSIDGYIGRISLDFVVRGDVTFGTGSADMIPGNATVIVLGDGDPSRPEDLGLVAATFDDPHPVGLDWAIWYVPEAGTALSMLFVGAIAGWFRRR